MRKGHSRRLVATTDPLMRPLPIIVHRKCLGHLAHFLQGLGTFSFQALLIESSVVSFDKAILLGVMGVAEHHCDSECMTVAHQSSREVTALGRSYPARIAV